ncbi:hypothetical protein ACWEJQ_30655, partial [Streptomyces albidoflavus]
PGWFEHLPLPRPVADRLHLAGEGVPPAFGVTTGGAEGVHGADTPSEARLTPETFSMYWR